MKSVTKMTFTLKASCTVYLTFNLHCTVKILMLILKTGSSNFKGYISHLQHLMNNVLY